MASTKPGNGKHNGRRKATQPILPALPLHLKPRPKVSAVAQLEQPESPVSQSKAGDGQEVGIFESRDAEDKEQTSGVSVLSEVSALENHADNELQKPKIETSEESLLTTPSDGVAKFSHPRDQAKVDIESQGLLASNGLDQSADSTTISGALSEVPQIIPIPKPDVLAWADEVAEQEGGLQTPSQHSNNGVSVHSSSASHGFPDQTPRFTSVEMSSKPPLQTPTEATPFTNGGLEDQSKISPKISQPHQNGTTRTPARNEVVTPALPVLADHLLQLAFTKEFSDTMIMINVGELQPGVCYAHAFLLTRSLRLRKLIERQPAPGFPQYIINLFPLRSILPHAFEAALRFFYSDTALSNEDLFPKSSSIGTTPTRTELLNYIISYWISGIELGLGPVTNRAANLLQKLIDWDIVEPVLKEAMDIVAVVWQRDDGKPFVSDYAQIGNRMIQIALEFLATRIDIHNFKLDNDAVPSLLRSRFSLLEDTRTKFNPALASMVFGSLTASTPILPSSPESENSISTPSFSDSIASKILLSLDYNDLDYFCHRISQSSGDAALHLLREVVDQRERKRMKIISNRTIPNKQRMTNSAIWEIAGFREYVENGQLRRERVGFLLPNKT